MPHLIACRRLVLLQCTALQKETEARGGQRRPDEHIPDALLEKGLKCGREVSHEFAPNVQLELSRVDLAAAAATHCQSILIRSARASALGWDRGLLAHLVCGDDT